MLRQLSHSLGFNYWNRIGSRRARASFTRFCNRSNKNSPSTSMKDSKAFSGLSPTDLATSFCQPDEKAVARTSFQSHCNLIEFNLQLLAIRNRPLPVTVQKVRKRKLESEFPPSRVPVRE